MSGTPKYKVFNSKGEYVASCKYAEDAGAICAAWGEGSSIRWGHQKACTLFVNGTDADAGESYDKVAQICRQRLDEIARQFDGAS